MRRVSGDDDQNPDLPDGEEDLEDDGSDAGDEETLDDQGNPEGTEYDDEGNPVGDMLGNPFGTIYDEQGNPTHDAEGNPFGTEYDDSGAIVAPAAKTPAKLPAAMSAQLGLTSEQRAILEERFTPDQIEGIEFVVTQRVQSAMASMSFASNAVAAALADVAPEFKASLLPRMNAFISTMSPEWQARPDSGENALLVVMDEERKTTGESMFQIMGRYAREAQPVPARTPRVSAVVPPAQRPPVPGGGVRPVVRRKPDASSRNASMLKSLYGLTDRQVVDMDLE